MGHRRSAVVTVRRTPDEIIAYSGIGHITAQVRLHWPDTATLHEIEDAARAAVEDALRLAEDARSHAAQ